MKGGVEAAKASKEIAQGTKATKSLAKAAESIEKGAARATKVEQVAQQAEGVEHTTKVAKAEEGVERAAKVEGVVEKTGEAGKVDGTFIPNISKRAPELLSGQLTEKQFLKCAEKYLGEGYTEVSEGRFLSKDGLRQVRYNLHEVRSFVHHAHFEIYNTAGGRVIENARVLINP